MMSYAIATLIALAVHKGLSGVLLYKAQNEVKFSFLTATLLGESLKLLLSLIAFYLPYMRFLRRKDYSLIDQSIPDYTDEKLLPEESIAFLANKKSQSLSSKNLLLLIFVAALYVAQNNLYLYASSLLRPTVMQAIWQLRIISTGISSAILLKRRFSSQQIMGMILLLLSVLLIDAGLKTDIRQSSDQDFSSIGVLAAILACSISGIAGVLVETVLKDQQTDIWMANCYMSLFSIAPAAFCMIYEVMFTRMVSGFSGFDSGWAWSVVLTHSVAGLLVSFATKYASSISKAFSGAFAILFTFFFSLAAGTRSSSLLPKETRLWIFSIGIVCLYLSTWLYAMEAGSKRKCEDVAEA